MKILHKIVLLGLIIHLVGCQSFDKKAESPKLTPVAFGITQPKDKVIEDIESSVGRAIRIVLEDERYEKLGTPKRRVISPKEETEGKFAWQEEWTYQETGKIVWIVHLEADEIGYRFFNVERKK